MNFTPKCFNVKNVVLTGNLTAIDSISRVFKDLESSFGIKFIIPELAQFGTVIGAALSDMEK